MSKQAIKYDPDYGKLPDADLQAALTAITDMSKGLESLRAALEAMYRDGYPVKPERMYAE